MLTPHAIQQYCLRKHNDISYYFSHPDVLAEIIENINNSYPTRYNPKQFFKGSRIKGIGAKEVILLENDSLIYAIRENTLVTVLSVPGTDLVSDFIMNNKIK